MADLFDVTVDELVRWNKLHSNHLSIGEKILILDISQKKSHRYAHTVRQW
ncbi:LysM peptidoglycan-binding domain-containing protein [Bacteroides thetaiotaomicron]|nr:LysM peptidoglycan-binding domain-containing protein [Bacteroides thetaiotaomicron]